MNQELNNLVEKAIKSGEAYQAHNELKFAIVFLDREEY